jgi:uncharacterized coiled-coil protein SlyX
MNSTPDLKPPEADDVLVARADERLAHAYEQIARADEQLARVTEKLSKMEQDAARHPAAVPRRKPSRGGSALRGLIGLLLAACIAVAAFASRSSYGDAAKVMISQWAPHLVSTLALPAEKSGLAAQPSPAAVKVAAAEPAPQQAATSSPVTAQDGAPTVAPASPEPAQLMLTMISLLSNVEQGIEELKAGQERMANDNARLVDQLRASQEQMTRLLARTSDQNLGPKTSAPPTSGAPSRQISSPARKPVPVRSAPQARAQPPARVLLDHEEQ